MKTGLILFLLVLCFASSIFANEKDSLVTMDGRTYRVVPYDSSGVYEQLIYEEEKQITSIGSTVAGTLGLSLSLIGLCGVYLVVTFDYDGESYNAGALLIPFAIVGIPLFSYNLYYWIKVPGHVRRRDELQRQYDDYKKRREGAKISALPFLDFINDKVGIVGMISF